MTNQVYNPKFLFFSRIISVIIAPFYLFFNLFRKTYSLDEVEIKSILVSEYHRIGDVFLIIPALKVLKSTFPDSKLVLLCCESAKDLVTDLNIADEVVSVFVPWTNWEWSPLKWLRVRSLARSFRKRNIDLAIDFKGDFRNSWFLWHVGSKIRLGYTATGGSYFFTYPKSFPFEEHQTQRALSLTYGIGCNKDGEKEKNPIYNDSGSIVCHAGAADPRRAWPIEKWTELIKSISRYENISIVKTLETEDLIQQLEEQEFSIDVFKGNLVMFKNWLKNQKLLIGTDSMPGHLASYLGLPVVSVFGLQNPQLTKPVGKWTAIVKPNTSCKHKRDHWRLCEKCISSISVHQVESAVNNLLLQVKRQG